MYKVTVNKDFGYSITSFSKNFTDEDDAYDFFEGELKQELEYELGEGLISDQEFRNIVNNNIYFFEDDMKSILIEIEDLND